MSLPLRVVLVAPPGRCQPQGTYHAVPSEGVARLAGALLAAGQQVTVVDSLIEGRDHHEVDGLSVRYGLSEADTAARIADAAPDLIGLSCPFTCTAPDVLGLARACGDRLPKVPVVLGGAHAAANADEILTNQPAVDYVAWGEGETTIVALAESLAAHGHARTTPGVAWRQGDVVKRGPPPEPLDLDRLPPPAWELFDLDAYARAGAPHGGEGSGQRFVPVTWSRGCRRHCAFCLTPELWGAGQQRRRSVASILQETDWLRRRFAVQELHVEDDCLLEEPDWFHEVLRGLHHRAPGLTLELTNSLDARRMDERTATALARAGASRVYLSFDAGAPDRPSRWIGKQVSPGQALVATQALRHCGIYVVGYFMLGFPGQTRADMAATVDYALTLPLDDVRFFIVTPFPGTPLHRHCAEQGWLVPGGRLVDYRFSVGQIRTPEFGPEDTEALRREGWERFHTMKAAQKAGASDGS